MERPQPIDKIQQRQVTGEIVYLNKLRMSQFVQAPSYAELSDDEKLKYDDEALQLTNENIPEILKEYEIHEYQPSMAIKSCLAMSDILLDLKKQKIEHDPMFRELSFIDIAVEENAETVLNKLKNISAGKLLAADDEQLGIYDEGDDIRKQNLNLLGVGLRVFGWEDKKYKILRNEESYSVLTYPSNEKNYTREFEISFLYKDPSNKNRTIESISLHFSSSGNAKIVGWIWDSRYSETGYEGHGFENLEDITEKDIADFGDLVAEIVGDEPTIL